MKLKDRVGVITGGASGIGLASTLRFLQEGAAVVIADYNVATGEAAIAEARRRGFEHVDFIRTDVAKEADVEAMIARAVDQFGGLDIVFNNAGVTGAIGPLTETTDDDWDYTFGIIAKGVFLGIKHGARAMKKFGRGGSIINTASIAGLSGGGGPLVYSAAKAAVINLTKGAALQLAADHIRVNAICPGGVLTPLTDRGDPAAAGKRMDEMQPWPEHGKPEHIAGAALFLASDDSTFVTGEALVVDGGLTAAGPDIWRRLGAAREASLPQVGVNRGSTGEKTSLRPARKV
jgi:NAD(P)-dependent dehydrogenase (short-subunit alcohol dehydrogenase family)